MDQWRGSRLDSGRTGWKVLEWSYFKLPHDGLAVVIYCGAAIVVFLIVCFALPAFWTIFQSAQSGDTDAARSLLLLLGGVATVPFLVWRAILKQLEANLQHHNHVTGLFIESIGKLGRTLETTSSWEGRGEKVTRSSTEARLGAIHALERIARRSPEDRVGVHTLLAAFLQAEGAINLAAQPDAALALKVINRRFSYDPSPRSDENLLILQGLHVPGLAPHISVVDHIDFSRAAFSASVSSPLVHRGLLFRHCILNECRFDAVKSEKVDDPVQIFEAIESKLYQTVFVRGNLQAARFTGCDLRLARFDGADLRKAVFHDCELDQARFDGANLAGAEFEGSSLEGTAFKKAWLKDTIFHLKAPIDTGLFEDAYGDLTARGIDRRDFDSWTWQDELTDDIRSALFEPDQNMAIEDFYNELRRQAEEREDQTSAAA